MRIRLLAVLIALVACTEEPTTATQPAHTEPGVTPSGLSRANGRADGITPQNIAPLYPKYDCSKVNETTWYCPYVGQVEFSDNPFWFDDRGGGQITWTGTDCSADLHACRFTSGGGQAGTYADRDLSRCIPGVDPNCERVLTDVNRTKIVRALSDFVRDPAQIADATVRQRCQAMLNNFNLLLGLGRVYEGGSDTPATDSLEHYGAWSPGTRNLHFDPWALKAATTGSNAAWQIANTALHEAAHYLGYNHSDPTIIPYRGRTPVYQEAYFKDLNPGSSGCMKP